MCDKDISREIFKKVVNEKLGAFLDEYGFSVALWNEHRGEIDGRTIKCIGKYLDAFDGRVDKSNQLESKYEKLLFAEIYLHYAKDRKGDIALELLTDMKFNQGEVSKLVVPQYIKEGLEWLLK
jgi:hypothetical protein